MHVGNRNKQIAHEEHVGGHRQCSTFRGQPRSTRNICPFSHYFPYVAFFVWVFSSLRCFLLLWCVFLIVSLFSLFCTFCTSCFSSFLFFSCSHFLHLPLSMFWEIPVCMLISHVNLYLSFRKKKVSSRETWHMFLKLSLFFNQFSHVSSAVLFLFLSFFLVQRKNTPKKKKNRKNMCSFDKPFL